LRTLLQDLPGDLPATIFIVVHIGESSILASVLNRCSALPVAAARSGVSFQHGRIYVGIPGMHLAAGR
jgi:two-component system chemotaxis response regulator CheB